MHGDCASYSSADYMYLFPCRNLRLLFSHIHNYTAVFIAKLENVEHCGGEPEQADRILMSDVTYSTFAVQCKLTQWNPH